MSFNINDIVSKHTQLAEWDKKHPLLFNTKDGKHRVWACWVVYDTIYRTDGLIDGKLKEPTAHTYKGNKLRSSEEQAELEAEKLWIKRCTDDFKPSSSDKEGKKIYNHVTKQLNANGGMIRGVRMFQNTQITTKTTIGDVPDDKHDPMLAKKYKDYNKNGEYVFTPTGKNLKFPVLVQPKVDGMRALPHMVGDKIFLQSRNGKYFVHLDHIRDEIKSWLSKKGYPDLILDGELYIHKLYRDKKGVPTLNRNGHEMKSVERYQFISEAVKITRTSPHDFEEFVEYWIFDIWDVDKTAMERHEFLKKLFHDYDGEILKIVPTEIAKDHDDIEKYMSKFIGENTHREGYEFEGVMIRDPKAKYDDNTAKSPHLLKYKRFEDAEWKIVGAERCNGGNQDGAIKWICEKEINGKPRKLTAKQTGDAEVSKELFRKYQKNPKKYIGKMINIRYNEVSKDDVPRFPRATAFVEDKD